MGRLTRNACEQPHARTAAGFRTTLLPASRHCLNQGPTLRTAPWGTLWGLWLTPVGPHGSSQWDPMAYGC